MHVQLNSRSFHILTSTIFIFNEFAIRLPAPAEQIVEALAEKSVLGGVPVSRLMPDSNMDDVLLVAATEANTEADLEIYEAALRDVLKGVSA